MLLDWKETFTYFCFQADEVIEVDSNEQKKYLSQHLFAVPDAITNKVLSADDDEDHNDVEEELDFDQEFNRQKSGAYIVFKSKS